MPVGFLQQQMEWREALDEATSLSDVEALADVVAQHHSQGLMQLGITLDERGDANAAAQEIRALMFVERFADDVDRRLEALGQ
jgi:molecular chaperone HscB